MMVIHKTMIVGKCPHGCADLYQAEFRVRNRVIPVERIQEEIDAATKEPIYQEDLTQALADSLGCEVQLEGVHGRFNSISSATPTP